MPLRNLALDALCDALARVGRGVGRGRGCGVQARGGLSASVHVRVDARVERVGGAGGVRAVGAFGSGLHIVRVVCVGKWICARAIGSSVVSVVVMLAMFCVWGKDVVFL